MRDEILKYIISEFGENQKKHYSYCLFPAEDCTCKRLKQIGYDTSLITGGYMDSFEMVSVLVFIEVRYSVRIPDRDAIPENFDTVNKIVELINRNKNDNADSIANA